MKKIIILFAGLFIAVSGLEAQDKATGENVRNTEQMKPQVRTLPRESWEEIEKQKMLFINDGLALTEEVSARFWPVYREMNNNKFAISGEISASIKAMKARGDSVTEKECAAYLEKIICLEQKRLDNKKLYYNKLKEIISSKKLYKLEDLERQFRHKLASRIGRKPAEKK